MTALGELLNLRDAKTGSPAWTQQYSYDALGRPLTRVEAEFTTTWTWGTSATAHEIGRLNNVSNTTDTEAYTYDSYGRPATHVMTFGGTAYTTSYAYNTLGKLATLTYPQTPLSSNRFAVAYNYTNGYLSSLQNDTGERWGPRSGSSRPGWRTGIRGAMLPTRRWVRRRRSESSRATTR